GDDGDELLRVLGVVEEGCSLRYRCLWCDRDRVPRIERSRPRHDQALRRVRVEQVLEGRIAFDHRGCFVVVEPGVRVDELYVWVVVWVHWDDLVAGFPDRFIYCTPPSDPDPDFKYSSGILSFS